MKTKTPLKTGKQKLDTQPTTIEPAWRRQQPAGRRSQMRQNQAVAPGLTGKVETLRNLALPTFRPRLATRHWVMIPLIAVAIFGLVQLFDNEAFFVFAAEVQGNQRLTNEEIYAASQIDGQNIFWVQPGEIDRRLAGLAGVLSTHTHVRLPNQVIIEVQEQTPLALWQVGSETIWVGEDGRPMPAVGGEPRLRLIDDRGAAAQTAPEDADNRGPRPSARIVAAIKALHASRPELTDIYYGEQEGLYFREPQGWTVYLGNTGDVAAKLARLQSMQKQIAAQEKAPEVIDLRLDGTAYFR